MDVFISLCFSTKIQCDETVFSVKKRSEGWIRFESLYYFGKPPKKITKKNIIQSYA